MRPSSSCALARRAPMTPSAPARAARSRPPARMIQGSTAAAPLTALRGTATWNRCPPAVNDRWTVAPRSSPFAGAAPVVSCNDGVSVAAARSHTSDTNTMANPVRRVRRRDAEPTWRGRARSSRRAGWPAGLRRRHRGRPHAPAPQPPRAGRRYRCRARPSERCRRPASPAGRRSAARRARSCAACRGSRSGGRPAARTPRAGTRERARPTRRRGIPPG